MKKIYETPEMEISKFSLTADILSISDDEEDLGNGGGSIGGGEDPGFSWGN